MPDILQHDKGDNYHSDILHTLGLGRNNMIEW